MHEQDISSVARRMFGVASLHAWQKTAIEQLLQPHAEVLLVAPTGGGKSITYQLPAAVLPGTAMVVSPLVALMEDQVRALNARQIPATWLSGTLSVEERRAREAQIARGAFKIVYVAPERAVHGSFRALVDRVCVSLVAIDEAHCIVQWGHDFRPEYRQVREFVEATRATRKLACTATATPTARNEIASTLGFAPARSVEILGGFARPNLTLRAVDVERGTEVLGPVREAVARRVGRPGATRGAAILYAATRRRAEWLGEALARWGYHAGSYHAGLPPSVRGAVATGFARREIEIVAATCAFGMGIDRPDVRLVVHTQIPPDLESYYQEAGRAGRDGEPAEALLVASPGDVVLRRKLGLTDGQGARLDDARIDRTWRAFLRMLGFVDARGCRHAAILGYFGAGLAIDRCPGCDRCGVDGRGAQTPAGAAVCRREADDELRRTAMRAIASWSGSRGYCALGDALGPTRLRRTRRGSSSDEWRPTALRGVSRVDVERVLRELLVRGWLELTPEESPTVRLTREGSRAMNGAAESAEIDVDSTEREAVDRVPEAAPTTRLRAWRDGVARAKGVPPVRVLGDRALERIETLAPQSFRDLVSRSGMDALWIAEYGVDVMRVLAR